MRFSSWQPAILPFIACVVLVIAGCSRGGPASPNKLVTIPEGQLVEDEPSVLVKGDFNKTHTCSLDTVNGKEMSQERTWEIKHGQNVTLSGWAFSEDGKETSAKIYVRLWGAVKTYYAVTTHKSARPDANRAHRIDPTLNVGFNLTAETDQVEPGAYQIMIMQAFAQGVEGCRSAALLLVD